MNIIGFLGAHIPQLLALTVSAFFVFFAKILIPYISRKERGNLARWCSFVCYAVAGIALAVAMVPFVLWLVGLGSRAGLNAIVGSITAIVAFALGWQGFAMLVGVIVDLADKVPNHQARQGALWVPTFLPIGGASIWQLLQNPQGLGQGLTAAVMAGITLYYAYNIANRTDGASEHKKGWSWFTFAIFLIAGAALVPLVAYVDTVLISHLPGPLQILARTALGLFGLVAVGLAVVDIVFDQIPQRKARIGAAYGMGTLFVFGGIGANAIFGSVQDGATFLNGVF